MVVLVYTLLGLVLVVLQTIILMVHPVWPAAPDLYFILVAYLAYRVDLLRGLIVLFPVSWAMDVFSGLVIGTYPAVCFLAFALLRIMDARMPVRESLYQIPLTGVTYLVVSRLVYTSLSFFSPDALAPWSWPLMLLRAVLLGLLAWPLFRFFAFVNRRLQQKIVPFTILRIRTGNRYRSGSGKS